MATQLLNLNNRNNWQPLYSTSVQAAYIGDSTTRHYRLFPVSVPFLIESRILAVCPDSTTAKDWWITAGWISRRIATGLVVGGNPNVRASETQRLIFREINLIVYPDFTADYELILDIPYWFDQWSVQVFEYTGLDENVDTNLLIESKNQLDRIEAKIDALP